jgi:hypothetical protein
MNSNLNMSRLTLFAVSFVAALSTAQAAKEPQWVALTSDVALNRSSIADVGRGDKSVWIQRNYDELISLGVDTATGLELYPHRSVQIQYVVNCAQYKLGMVSWKMFSGVNSQGTLVWAAESQGSDASYRHRPSGEEEKSVTANVCGSSVGSR